MFVRISMACFSVRHEVDCKEEIIVRKSDASVKKELSFNNLIEKIQGHLLPLIDMGATRKIRKRTTQQIHC